MHIGHDPEPNRCRGQQMFGDGWHDEIRCQMSVSHRGPHAFVVEWTHDDKVEFENDCTYCDEDDESLAIHNRWVARSVAEDEYKDEDSDEDADAHRQWIRECARAMDSGVWGGSIPLTDTEVKEIIEGDGSTYIPGIR